MMRGKNKCKILKQIRQKIADENDIPYVTRECSYQGECSGTCPKCEAELRYLEQQLARRQALGRTVTVAALAASLSLGVSGCVPTELSGRLETDPAATLPQLQTEQIDPTDPDSPEPTATEGEPVELDGDVSADPYILGELPVNTDDPDSSIVYGPSPASFGDFVYPGSNPLDEDTLPVVTITPEPASSGDLDSNG